MSRLEAILDGERALRRQEQPRGEAGGLGIDWRFLGSRSGSAQPSSPIRGTKATAPKSSSSKLSLPVRRTRISV